jgi:hypothetical protein
MKNIKLGFGTDGERPLEIVEAELKEYLTISDEAIELSLTKLTGILEFPFEKVYPLLMQFKYRSIHLPVVKLDENQTKIFLTYPNIELEPYLDVIKKLAHDLKINTYVAHPDQISDFEWANNEFGELLGFENMDNRKAFGICIDDMNKVFTKSPQAKWIFDVNHLFTNDSTLASASDFFSIFRERLTHYHVSAFGGFHSSFTKNPEESFILKAVLDLSYPMIHEGYNSAEGYAADEYLLIQKLLTSKR